jgi:hypothetical protein
MSGWPVGIYFAALIIGLLLLLWDSRRPTKEVTIVISPLALAVTVSVIAVGFWAYYFYDRSQGPVTWHMGRPEYPIFSMRGGGEGARPLITAFQFSGTNRYDEPIRKVSGKLLSNITGKEYQLYFRVNGKFIKVEETRGIPSLMTFLIIAPITEDQAQFDSLLLPANQFLSQFGDVTLTVNLDDHSSVRRFRQDELTKVIEDFERSLRRSPEPTITAR